MNIGIAATAISGIGVTTKMPSTVFAVKIAENKFKVARTAAEALQTVPKVLDLTTVGVGTTQLVFDIHIPYDSFLRDSSIAGTALTISSISVNDYFIIRNSNVGLGSTSVTSFDSAGNTVGVGTSFADNVYQVASAESISTSVSGISTYVRRLFVDVNDFVYGVSGMTTSDNFGSFSWGRIDITARAESNSYNSYTLGGIGISEGTGISTSTLITRSNFLKFKNYIV